MPQPVLPGSISLALILVLFPQANAHWTKDGKCPGSIARLRKIAEETKNHDLERDLYIEERKAERGVYLRQRWDDLKKEGWKNWFAIRGDSWPTSSGSSSCSAIGRLPIMAVAFCGPSHGSSRASSSSTGVTPRSLHWLKVSASDVDKYKQALGMLALGNAVPFVGPLTIDTKIKEFLFCPNNAESCLPPIPPEGFQLLVIFQNLFSITCVFFIGLALRNYFRIK